MSASTSLPVKVRRDPVFPSAPGPFFEIAVGEWKLQTRSWGSWLLVLLCLLVVVSEHPLFTSHSGTASLAESAATWADRIAVFGSMMAILIAPFVLDRVRRAGAAEVELSKPFPGGAYVLGKLAGVAGFTLAAILGSGVVHMGITLFGGADLVQAAWAYTGQAVQIALPPVVFALAAGFFLSMWIHPVAVTAGYVVYLVNSSLSQSAANARLSWLSPMVRPDYFHYAIPPEWQPVVNAHITLYYALSLALAVLAVTLFNRQNFLDGRARKSLKEWLRLSMDVAGRMGRLPVLSPSLRRVLGIPTLVALLLAVAIPSMTLQAGLEFTDLRIDHAFLALEFYLSLCGLLFMAGGLGLDQSSRALDLVLVKPANRWRLLAERLLPGLGIYLFLILGMAAYIHFTY
ncbi:MAG: hypothetical protein EHM70_17045 [Chloroflexota bacterium]|nr:MAG: hypothetical protein EHM70_17045 [Chloroflexota bacterium]